MTTRNFSSSSVTNFTFPSGNFGELDQIERVQESQNNEQEAKVRSAVRGYMASASKHDYDINIHYRNYKKFKDSEDLNIVAYARGQRNAAIFNIESRKSFLDVSELTGKDISKYPDLSTRIDELAHKFDEIEQELHLDIFIEDELTRQAGLEMDSLLQEKTSVDNVDLSYFGVPQ